MSEAAERYITGAYGRARPTGDTPKRDTTAVRPRGEAPTDPPGGAVAAEAYIRRTYGRGRLRDTEGAGTTPTSN